MPKPSWVEPAQAVHSGSVACIGSLLVPLPRLAVVLGDTQAVIIERAQTKHGLRPLGFLYYRGQGVTQDYGKGARVVSKGCGCGRKSITRTRSRRPNHSAPLAWFLPSPNRFKE